MATPIRKTPQEKKMNVDDFLPGDYVERCQEIFLVIRSPFRLNENVLVDLRNGGLFQPSKKHTFEILKEKTVLTLTIC